MPMIELTPTQTIMYNKVLFDGFIATDQNTKAGAYTSGTTILSDSCNIGPAQDIASVGNRRIIINNRTVIIVSPYTNFIRHTLH